MSVRWCPVAAVTVALHGVSFPAWGNEVGRAGDWEPEWGGRAAWLERLQPDGFAHSGVGISLWGGYRQWIDELATTLYLGVGLVRFPSDLDSNHDVAAVVGTFGLRLAYRVDSVEFHVEGDVGISYVNQVISDTASYSVKTAGVSPGIRGGTDVRVSKELRLGVFVGYREMPMRPLSLSGRTDLEIIEAGIGLTFGAQ